MRVNAIARTSSRQAVRSISAARGARAPRALVNAPRVRELLQCVQVIGIRRELLKRSFQVLHNGDRGTGRVQLGRT